MSEDSRVLAARLLIEMLAKDEEPIDEDLWRIAGGSVGGDES